MVKSVTVDGKKIVRRSVVGLREPSTQKTNCPALSDQIGNAAHPKVPAARRSAVTTLEISVEMTMDAGMTATAMEEELTVQIQT